MGWGSGWWGVRVDVNGEVKKIGGVRSGVGLGGGGQGRCEQRSDFFVKIQRKIFFFFFFGGGGSGLGGQSGCERKIEVFEKKSPKKIGGRRGEEGGVQVGVCTGLGCGSG